MLSNCMNLMKLAEDCGDFNGGLEYKPASSRDDLSNLIGTILYTTCRGQFGDRHITTGTIKGY